MVYITMYCSKRVHQQLVCSLYAACMQLVCSLYAACMLGGLEMLNVFMLIDGQLP